MIVDAHCHAGHGDGLTGPWDTVAGLETAGSQAELGGAGLWLRPRIAGLGTTAWS